METYEALLEQGFNNDEIIDLSKITDALGYYLGNEPATINWKAVASLEADMLSQTGKTEKVREFAKRIYNKLKEFS